MPHSPTKKATPVSPLLVAEPARGLCKVLCYHPDHSLTLARMTREQIHVVVDSWTQEFIEFLLEPEILKRAMMGASNPHPHGQIWSTGFIPDEPAAETMAQRDHLARTGRCLLCDYITAERVAGERIVFEDEHFMAVVPWWAVWPFEVLLVSRRHLGMLPEFTEAERDGLAEALKRLTTRFDNLFECSFPYTMGFHQSPTDEKEHPEWHFHAHFYPPLLRSATVRKFMVGFEMLGMPQRCRRTEGTVSIEECGGREGW